MNLRNLPVALRQIALVLPLALAACATGNGEFGGAPGLSVVPIDELPAPNAGDVGQDPRAYHIGPFDKLVVGAFGIEGLEDRELQVDASGRFSFPLAGVVNAGGKTLEQLEAEIADRLRQAHVRDPKVTVNLKETVNRTMTVDGQVAKPGIYPVLGRMSLIRAVAVAGSTTEFAALEDVVVFREVGDRRYAGLYNLKAIRNGAYDDPEIYANDVIVVGDSPSRRLFKDILQAAPLLTTPLIYIFSNNN